MWIPKIKPVARNRRWDKEKKTYINGNVFLWEVKWMDQTWYVYRDNYRWFSNYYNFPYQGIEETCEVKRIGHLHFWRGTYKD